MQAGTSHRGAVNLGFEKGQMHRERDHAGIQRKCKGWRRRMGIVTEAHSDAQTSIPNTVIS
jgi:hypothetical protein